MAKYNATEPGQFIYVVVFTQTCQQNQDVLVHLALDGFSKHMYEIHCELQLSKQGMAALIRNVLGELIETLPGSNPTFIFGYAAELLRQDYAPKIFQYINDPAEAYCFAIPFIQKIKTVFHEHYSKLL